MRFGLPPAALRPGLRLFGRWLFSPNVSWETSRKRFDMSLQLPPPRGTRVTQIELGGVPAEDVRPPGADPGRVILYLHGGGYVVGSAKGVRAFVGALGRDANARVCALDYRMGPEHAAPAAIDDALSAYRALRAEGVPAERIAVAGDSAGAGLTLALALRLREAGEALPAVLGLVSPWVDLTEDAAWRTTPAPNEPLLTVELLERFAQAYAGDADRRDPTISPLHADLSGLPPMVIHTGGDDLLACDGHELERRARAAGVEVEHRVDEGVWHDHHLFATFLGDPAADAPRALGESLGRRLGATAGRDPKVAIIGAGMSGICVGALLDRAGANNFTIYEKRDRVGGTWRENTYPGLSCDVSSRYYTLSFLPNKEWSHLYPPGDEIQDYFERAATELGLRSRIRFETEIAEATWVDGRWRVRTTDGQEEDYDFVVGATGFLHHPKVPEIEGLESFEGAVFHSARWDHSVPLEDARVGVIGNGSTGVQIVAALGGKVRHLTLFQRTPQWVFPMPNPRYTPVTRVLSRHLPGYNQLAYRVQRTLFEHGIGTAAVEPGFQRRLLSALCRVHLRRVRDPELRRRLTPPDVPMCKRMIMSWNFYPAVTHERTTLADSPIVRVEPRGVRTADGTLHELDVLALATGFHAHEYLRPIELVGPEGNRLSEVWSGEPRAYKTVALPGFPNFFLLAGPHSPIGNQSICSVTETAAEYVVECIKLWRSGQFDALAPRVDATAEFNESMRAALPDTVWVTGCDSWYIGEDGLPALWPWRPTAYRELLAAPELAEYELSPAE